MSKSDNSDAGLSKDDAQLLVHSESPHHGSLASLAELQSLIGIAVSRQNDVLLITSVKGTEDRIVFANAAITRHSGYTPEEVVGNTPRMFQGPDTSRATRDVIRAAIDAREPVQAEILNYRKDGTTFWTEMNISPIFNSSGIATHMVSVQRDITEKRITNDALRRKDQRFLLALEASANAIWEWTIDTDTVEYRDEIQGWSWHGEHYGQIKGQGLGILLELLHPEDRGRVQQSLTAKIAGCEVLDFERYRFRRPDGSYAEVNDRQFILRMPDGKAERLIGSIVDTSEKRSLENRLPQFQRLEMLGEMTSGIAHNFNNLLTVILGNVDRLRVELVDGEAGRNTLRMIDEAAQRGAALTDHLMSFSQVEKLALKAVDIRYLIENIAPVWGNLLPPEIRFDISYGPELWAVKTDPVHLEAVILNLVINARDAMPKGGILSITVENLNAESCPVQSPAALEPSRHVLIRVCDTGSGMLPEDAALAFDPFFTTKPTGKGTGLGLSSAYGFMRKSGGFISLESAPDRGTTVSVFVRVAEDAPVPDVTTNPKRLVKDGGHRVLVVDDDQMVREYVQALLTSLNYEIVTAATGAEALQILASDPEIDLLFTDILMEGGMNGWELARQSKAICPDLPVLYTSAYPDPAAFPKEIQAHAPNILRKPYRARDLSIAILSAIAADQMSTDKD